MTQRTNQRKLLNDRAVAAARPSKTVGDTYVWDTKLGGFGLRIKPSRSKAFVVMRRLDGKVRRWNIGRDGMGAKKARAEAHRLIQGIEAGEDPTKAAEDAQRASERRQEGTITNIVAKYLAGPVKGLRTLKERRGCSRCTSCRHGVPG